MTNRELLIWIHQRLVEVHGESKYVDYMHRLREVIHDMPKDKQLSGIVNMKSNEILDEIEKSQY